MKNSGCFWLLVILVLALLLVCWHAVLAADGLPESPAPTPGATVGPPPLPQPPAWDVAAELVLPIIQK